VVRLDTFQPGALRALRKARGLTQRELADRIGTTDRTVMRWEGGAGTPAIELIPTLAAALACRPEQLLEPVVVDTLQTLRRRAGLSQRALAAALGVNQSTYSRIERGTSPLDTALVADIATALKVGRREVEAAYDAGTNA
jgi:transcriptional regulator with XRE-family HTH domain